MLPHLYGKCKVCRKSNAAKSDSTANFIQQNPQWKGTMCEEMRQKYHIEPEIVNHSQACKNRFFFLLPKPKLNMDQ